MVNRNFGSVRELPSGNFQARVRRAGFDDIVHTVPTEDEAYEFLEAVRVLVRSTRMTSREIERHARR